jgi:chitinase
MIFNYMNLPEVWSQFCATYEAIYQDLLDFDSWASANGHNLISLAFEWQFFITKTLISVTNIARDEYGSYVQAV